MISNDLFKKNILKNTFDFRFSIVIIFIAVLFFWFYILLLPPHGIVDIMWQSLPGVIMVPFLLVCSWSVFLLLGAIIDAMFRKEMNSLFIAVPLCLCLLAFGFFFTDPGRINAAAITGNIFFCEKVSIVGANLRARCYLSAAQSAGNNGREICDMINWDSVREDCYAEVAK